MHPLPPRCSLPPPFPSPILVFSLEARTYWYSLCDSSTLSFATRARDLVLFFFFWYQQHRRRHAYDTRDAANPEAWHQNQNLCWCPSQTPKPDFIHKYTNTHAHTQTHIIQTTNTHARARAHTHTHTHTPSIRYFPLYIARLAHTLEASVPYIRVSRISLSLSLSLSRALSLFRRSRVRAGMGTCMCLRALVPAALL